MHQTGELESDTCHVDVRGSQICSLECLSNSSAWGASLSEYVNSLSLHRGTPSTASIAAERESSHFSWAWSFGAEQRCCCLVKWQRVAKGFPRVTSFPSDIPPVINFDKKKKVRVTKERRRSSGWLLCKVPWYKEICQFCYFLENNPRIQVMVDVK